MFDHNAALGGEIWYLVSRVCELFISFIFIYALCISTVIHDTLLKL